MTQIGEFHRTRTGYDGRLHTLALDVRLTLIPAEPSDAENAPEWRVMIGSGEAALEVGLVNRVLPPTEVNAYAQAQARKLAAKPLSALIETKRLMKGGQAALVREVQEELGLASEVGLLVGVLENIFEHQGRQGHEIVFVYRASFTEAGPYAAPVPFTDRCDPGPPASTTRASVRARCRGRRWVPSPARPGPG